MVEARMIKVNKYSFRTETNADGFHSNSGYVLDSEEEEKHITTAMNSAKIWVTGAPYRLRQAKILSGDIVITINLDFEIKIGGPE